MSENIIYSNKEEFLEKLNNFKEDGLKKIHFLADFDNTLTKAFVNGKRTASLVSLLRGKEGALGIECSREDSELFKKYHRIEVDPHISYEKKSEKMVEWWTKSFNLFIKYGLTKNILKNIAKSEGVKLRYGVGKFINIASCEKIPVVIISASGIGTKSIKYFLEERGLMFNNVDIVSNDFEWDEEGRAISYKKPIIHSFNKTETVLEDYKNIYPKIKYRKNVILLGDSLGDHHMVDGFDYNNLIKVGFLNNNEDELLGEYKKRYDIIIIGDGDFTFINNLLRYIRK